MVVIDAYLTQLTDKLLRQYGNRLLYVGLQGSYLRGEATESSDIDIMVILDGLSLSDMDAYRNILQTMEQPDKSCGFICSREDLAAWNPMELCHLRHTTRDHYGVLDSYLPSYTEQDVRNFVKMSLNNLYHELCHRYIHGDPENTQKALPALYKSVFFILQNLCYLRTGHFAQTKQGLLPMLSHNDREIMNRSLEIAHGIAFDFSESYNLLFHWCQDTLQMI